MTFKKRLSKAEPLLGTWLTLPSTAIAEMACRAGFDWMAIDLEHSSMTTAEAQELIRVIDLMGKIPLVRLSHNGEVLIKKVMDAGAHGVIVPMVKSLKDVQDAFSFIHYPPKGRRGVGLARAQKYGSAFKEYWDWLNGEAILLIQLEHKDVLNHLDAIFGSGLVDGYIIGPYDLSASLNIPGQFQHPELISALQLIAKKADQYGVPKGIHQIEMESLALKDHIDAGYKIIAYGVDFRVLEGGFRNAKLTFEKILSGQL